MKVTDIGDIDVFLDKVYLLIDCTKNYRTYPFSRECLCDGYVAQIEDINEYQLSLGLLQDKCVIEVINIDNALKYKKNIKCDDISKCIKETYEIETGNIVVVNDSNICLACKKDHCGSLYFYNTNKNGSTETDNYISYSGNKIMYTCRDKFNEKIYLVEIGSNLSREEKIKMNIIEDKTKDTEKVKEEIKLVDEKNDSLDNFRFFIEVKDDDGHELNFKSKEESFTAVSECLDYISRFEKINYVHLSGDSDLIVYAVNRLLETFKIKLIFSKTYSDKDKTIMCLEAKE